MYYFAFPQMKRDKERALAILQVLTVPFLISKAKSYHVSLVKADMGITRLLLLHIFPRYGVA